MIRRNIFIRGLSDFYNIIISVKLDERVTIFQDKEAAAESGDLHGNPKNPNPNPHYFPLQGLRCVGDLPLTTGSE